MNWGYDKKVTSDKRLEEIDFTMKSSKAFVSVATPLVVPGGMLHKDIHACNMVNVTQAHTGTFLGAHPPQLGHIGG